MGVDDIPLFGMLRGRLGWLSERQRVVAENVANADTPGYRARDLSAPADFSQALDGARGVGMMRTSAAHIPSSPGATTGCADSAGATELWARWLMDGLWRLLFECDTD